jgi:hypothetical protein
MSQRFKLKYEDINAQDADGDNANTASGTYDHSYKSETRVRNLCFVFQDGKKTFLNYGYLVKVDFYPDNDTIIMIFTSDKIRLKGVNMDTLFYDLLDHIPRQIVATDPRYNLIGEDQKPVINEIEIIKTEQ